MILTTTNEIEGKSVTSYLGIVSATTYASSYTSKGMSFSDMFKSKKYYEAYEAALEDAKESAFQKLKENAKNLKADAIVGIHLDVESVSAGAYTMISIVGTAVAIE
jgi:uncharacterized protein YbjQ (UPF0145 family)